MNRKIHFGGIFAASILLGLMLLGFRPEPLAEAARNGPGDIPVATKQHLLETYGKLPLSFEANVGQTSGQVAFLSGGQGYKQSGGTSVPVAAQPAISAALGREDSRYRVRTAPGGFRAENPHQALAAEFTAQGIEVRSGTAQWELALRGYGYGDALQPVGLAAPQASANRVEYPRGALTEWYVNGPVGLEQGFTLAERPGRSNGEPLTIALAPSKNLMASADAGGAGLTLTRSDGEAALRYSGLVAYDATGRELRAWLELRGEQLLLRVADTGAQYPVTVDPFI